MALINPMLFTSAFHPASLNAIPVKLFCIVLSIFKHLFQCELYLPQVGPLFAPDYQMVCYKRSYQDIFLFFLFSYLNLYVNFTCH